MVGSQHQTESQHLCQADSMGLSLQIHEGRGWHKGPNSHLPLTKNAWLGATLTLLSQWAKKAFKKVQTSPTCRFEHRYTKPTPTYGMPPWTVGTTIYIWYMSMQFDPRISNPYSPSANGTERSQNHIKGGIHLTQGAGSEDYPRYGGYLDQEQSQQHQNSNGEHPLPQPWQLWGYQKWQADVWRISCCTWVWSRCYVALSV